MFQNLMQNLSKKQKIGIVILIQILIFIVIAVWANIALQPKPHVEVVNESGTNIPDDNWRGLKDELWNLIEGNVEGLAQSDIDDAVIRDGTYEESTENDITTATFLMDIDSIRQTYAITVSWSNKVELYDTISIDCPPLDQMKYPDTVCYGMYNSTYSLDLYLPYAVYPEGHGEEGAYPMAPNYLIEGDESTKTIDIIVSSCAPDIYKMEALEYLNSTPINLSDYEINYTINSTDVDC